ncbi:hypothetical protein F6Y05_39565 [Bacillus megaterium]|nr:hypothetical protein [Priestia megaterium]
MNPSLKLFHHPYEMKDLEKALDRLLKAFAKNEKILFLVIMIQMVVQQQLCL